MGKKSNILVVGAGFAGATAARLLANHGLKVTVIDIRNHLAGNAYDYIDNQTGIRIHKYGPHIFHTNNEKVYNFVIGFGEWINYEHKVLAQLRSGKLVPFPPNINTMKYVDSTNLIDIFYKPYSEKMWGTKFNLINSDIIDRVKIRQDDDDRYFKDTFQILPKLGYSNIIAKMLHHSNININLQTRFCHEMLDEYDHCFASMSIDEFYQFKFGILPYRSIRFENIKLPLQRVFPCSVVNLTDSSDVTRITEWKNFPNSDSDNQTILTLERPCDFEDNNYERYYPVKQHLNLYHRYKSLEHSKITFIGRCGLYAYLDMDMAISSTFAIVDKFLNKL